MIIEIPLLEIIEFYKKEVNKSLALTGKQLEELTNFQFYTKDDSENYFEIPITTGIIYVRFTPPGIKSLITKANNQ